MKQWLRKMWFEHVIKPYLDKNKAKCAVAMRDTIVYQMWAANIKFGQINKWLHKMQMPTIKGFVMTKTGPHLFYELPEAGRRREIESIHGRITLIL